MVIDSSVNYELEALETKLTGPHSFFALEKIDGEYAFRRRPQSLNEIYQKSSSRSEKPFIFSEGRTWNHQEIFGKAAALAQTLVKHHGAGPGVRIGILGDNSAAWVVSFIAVTMSGAVAVLLRSGHWPKFARLASCCVVLDVNNGLPHSSFSSHEKSNFAVMPISLSMLGDGAIDIFAPLRTSDDDGAVISLTSGTSGEPKLVFQSQRAVVSGIMNMLLAAALSRPAKKDQSVPGRPPSPLLAGPLSHVSGYTQILISALFGNSFCLVTSNAQTIARSVAAYGSSSIIGIDTETSEELFKLPDLSLSSLRTWNISGFSACPDLVGKICGALPEVQINTSYGLTESNGGISTIGGDMLKANPGSSGRVVPSVQIESRGEDGAVLPAGAAGEIWLKGQMLMSGYLNQNGAMHGLHNGWFSTGDYGFISSSRHLHILSRKEGIFRFGSSEINSSQIEQILRAQTGVLDASVVLSSAEKIVAVIVPLPGTMPDLGHLKAAAMAECRLPSNKIVITYCEALPKTISGKTSTTDVQRALTASTADGEFLRFHNH